MENIKFAILFFSYCKQRTKNNGFTLIELISVMIFLGILSALALPLFLTQANRARQAEAETNLGAITRAQQIYRTSNSSFGTLQELSDSGTLSLNIQAGTATTEYYTYTNTVAAGGQASQMLGTARPNFTQDITDYASAIFLQTPTNIFFTVMCRANDSSAIPQADADPAAANACVNSTPVN